MASGQALISWCRLDPIISWPGQVATSGWGQVVPGMQLLPRATGRGCLSQVIIEHRDNNNTKVIPRCFRARGTCPVLPAPIHLIRLKRTSEQDFDLRTPLTSISSILLVLYKRACSPGKDQSLSKSWKSETQVYIPLSQLFPGSEPGPKSPRHSIGEESCREIAQWLMIYPQRERKEL